MKRAVHVLSSVLALAVCLQTRPALAWEWFRSESSAVERGNEHLAKGQHEEALKAYDEAARELPNDPAVQLDRGLALQSLGKLGEAREAFRRAGSAASPKDIRGPALYDLGLAFMQEADTAGKADDLDGAKKLLEESVDAFRGSLRAQPSNKDAAWNLELAKRRLVDTQKKQEEKKKQDEEEKKDDQNKDKNKDDQNKDDQNKDDQNKDQQPDAGAPERGDGGSQNQNDGQGEPDAGAPPQPEPQGADAGGDKPEQKPEEEPQDEQPSEPEKQEPNALPEHMKRALDALESGEENLEKLRAKQRARSRPRRIDKDW
jgi:Ca-activated chloride channel family protein